MHQPKVRRRLWMVSFLGRKTFRHNSNKLQVGV